MSESSLNTPHSSRGSTAEETILEAARHARRMNRYLRGGAVSIMGFGVATVVGGILSGRHGLASSPLFPWYCGVALAGLPLLFCYVYEEQSAGVSFGELSDLLAPGQGDVRQSVSAASIAPLLDTMMPGAIHGGFLEALAALLGSLLTSVRTADGVVLTAVQRDLLHELVKRKLLRWDWLKTSYGPWIDAPVRRELRLPAIRSLGALGNISSVSVLERFARKTKAADLREAALQSVEQLRTRLPDVPKG